MPVEVRSAVEADVPALAALMTSFYAESDLDLPVGRAARVFEALLSDPRLGGAWIAESDGAAVGHAVVTVSFSMEYGAMRGVVEDLYVRPEVRGRGFAAALLNAVRAAAIDRGIRALQVEVAPGNRAALQLYARAGYVDGGHALLTLPIAAPVHADRRSDEPLDPDRKFGGGDR